MNLYLKSFGENLPVIWSPTLAGVLLVFTILAWCIPSWRGNAIGAVFGFFASLGGIRFGSWLAQHPPAWARSLYNQLQREAPHTDWIDLRPHMTRMFLTLIVGGLAYLIGMTFGKILVRLWLRRAGSNYPPEVNRNVLSPFH